uniref:Ribosomal protein S6 kinase-like 1 n=1 Tax=Ceratitis capitata TaxID=7213 RepID=W8BHY1_CERCA
MSPNLDGWIHSFTVTDTLTHKGGYTIYKITSIVFPRSLPQALTCLTIWKRFHDVKRLHRELSRRHRSLKLPGQLPEPTDCSFFKRFDANVISRRKEYILQLLDFVAQHSALYKCHAFTQFFSEAQQTGIGGVANRSLNNTSFMSNVSPLHHLYSTEVRRNNGKSELSDNLSLRCDTYDMKRSITEFDSLNTNQQNVDKLKTTAISTYENEDNIGKSILVGFETDKNVIHKEDEKKETPCNDYKRFLTPMASIESDDSDYIYEAALEFSKAVQGEANLDYQEAHMRYKRGVELLLFGSKDDTNDERRFIAKAKISKYLARADDIYEKFLCDNSTQRGFGGGVKNFQLSIDVTESTVDGQPLYLERPWNHLAKYKVLKVLGDSVMQVYCVTEPEPRAIYVMKGIEKPSSNAPTQTIFLPQHVPYMVDLLAFFQSDQKIFLLLQHAEGGRLYDYIQSYTPRAASRASNYFSVLFPDEMEPKTSLNVNCTQNDPDSTQDSDYAETISMPSSIESNYVDADSSEFSELVRSSQKLLQSVSKTLQQIKKLEETPNTINKTSDKDLEASKHDECSPSGKVICEVYKIPEASLKQWARELAVVIHSLHGKGVILGDLHMDNLLLGAKGQLLLTYFYQNEGLSDTDSYMHKAYSHAALDGHYVAPERPLTFRSDWWSYGVILYQLLLGLPFKSTHPGNMDLYGFLQYPENFEISECAKDLLEKLLQQKPEERADYDVIQKHTFFSGTNWESLQNC